MRRPDYELDEGWMVLAFDKACSPSIHPDPWPEAFVVWEAWVG